MLSQMLVEIVNMTPPVVNEEGDFKKSTNWNSISMEHRNGELLQNRYPLLKIVQPANVANIQLSCQTSNGLLC